MELTDDVNASARPALEPSDEATMWPSWVRERSHSSWFPAPAILNVRVKRRRRPSLSRALVPFPKTAGILPPSVLAPALLTTSGQASLTNSAARTPPPRPASYRSRQSARRERPSAPRHGGDS